MPYELELPDPYPDQQWKVKIRDKERVEPPHVTIICRTRSWRLNLRDGELMTPPGGSRKEIPKPIWRCIEAHWNALCQAWDGMYPSNPIRSDDDDNDDVHSG